MNKYGYTMVELLAVIAIIGLLFTIATISYTSLIRKSNNTVYENYIYSIHEAVQTYIIDNPVENGKNETISLNTLISNNKIGYINNPNDNNDKCLSSYVIAKRNDKDGVINYEYDVYLICNDYNKYQPFKN